MDVHKEARVPTDPTPRVFDLNINLSELRQILSKTYTFTTRSVGVIVLSFRRDLSNDP